MRRWFEFGVDPTFVQVFSDKASDWSVSRPAFVSMQHKAETLTILQNAYGNGVARNAIYLQLAFPDDLYVPPASDCNANHLPPGYSMALGLSPLGNFLFNGFPNWLTGLQTPPIYLLSFDRPTKFGG